MRRGPLSFEFIFWLQAVLKQEATQLLSELSIDRTFGCVENPIKGAGMDDLSIGWKWDDNQDIEQDDWNNRCLTGAYEPILRKQAVIFQSYPDGKPT